MVKPRIQRGKISKTKSEGSSGKQPEGLSFNYDVFLSFKGKDTRKGFTGHLYEVLKRIGIQTFIDDEGLVRGERITDLLMQAIRGCRIAIPIFSSSYADSKWCLWELAKIVESGRPIIPIFFDVNPSDVRHQKGAFYRAFQEHKRRFDPETVKEWRNALTAAAERAGFDLKNVAYGDEAKLVKMVTERVLRMLNQVASPSSLPIPIIKGPTTTKYWTSIMEDLNDPYIQKIGVWGMAGVGKTCIVLNVHNALQEASKKLFDHVIFVCVSYEGSLRDVRNEIGMQLLIKEMADEQNESIAAESLKKKLQRGKFLLILDDLWRSIDLQTLGVPEPTEENGCKVLVTTRHRSVCTSMGAQNIFKVMPLPSEEAWQLFCERVGENPDSVEATARQAADKCGGLPLAIIAAAESLKNERNYLLWLTALDLIQSVPLNKRMKQAFDCLRLSYDRLESGALKELFLSCAFYVDRFKHEKDRLAIYIGIEGFTKGIGIGFTFAEGFDQLNKLKDACMLEDCLDDENCVCIHEFMRIMALQMTSGRFIAMNACNMEHLPRRAAWDSAEKLSLRFNLISRLPPWLNCPRLNSLLIDGNCYLEDIPETFFEHMEPLLVLDLSHTGLSRLPESLAKLKNLRYLRMVYCWSLKTIKFVGALRNLVYLMMTGCTIEELPEEISGLTELRVFYLDGTTHLKRIPSGVMSKLSCLEKLHMHGSAYAWRVAATSTKATLQELQSLSGLDTLTLTVAGKRDFDYIKEAVARKQWSKLQTLKCYIQENSRSVRLDSTHKVSWTTKTEEDELHRFTKCAKFLEEAFNPERKKHILDSDQIIRILGPDLDEIRRRPAGYSAGR